MSFNIDQPSFKIASLNLNNFPKKLNTQDKSSKINKLLEEYKEIDIWALQELTTNLEKSITTTQFFQLLRKPLRLKTYKKNLISTVNIITEYVCNQAIPKEIYNHSMGAKIPETDYNTTMESGSIGKNFIYTGFCHLSKAVITLEKYEKNKPASIWNKLYKRHLNFLRFDDDTSTNFLSSFWTECIYTFNDDEIRIINIHIPSNSGRELFMNTLLNYLLKVKKENVILIGDYNASSSQLSDNSLPPAGGRLFFELLTDKSLGFKSPDSNDARTYTYRGNGGVWRKLDHLYLSSSFCKKYKCDIDYIHDVNLQNVDYPDDFSKSESIEAFTDHSMIIATISILESN